MAPKQQPPATKPKKPRHQVPAADANDPFISIPIGKFWGAARCAGGKVSFKASVLRALIDEAEEEHKQRRVAAQGGAPAKPVDSSDQEWKTALQQMAESNAATMASVESLARQVAALAALHEPPSGKRSKKRSVEDMDASSEAGDVFVEPPKKEKTKRRSGASATE